MLEIARRVTVAIQAIRRALKSGDDDCVRRMLGDLFYDLDDWLMRLEEPVQ